MAAGFELESQEQITRRQILVQTRKKFLTIPETPAYGPHKMSVVCKFILSLILQVDTLTS